MSKNIGPANCSRNVGWRKNESPASLVCWGLGHDALLPTGDALRHGSRCFHGSVFELKCEDDGYVTLRVTFGAPAHQ
jgi:hypothetical protein